MSPKSTPSRAIAPALASLRLRIRLWLMLDRGSALIGTALAICIAAGLLDYLIRMPRPMRIGLWLIGLAFLVEGFRRFFLPAFRFRPSLSDLALRIEQTDAGRESGLRDVLAAGLEFGDEPSPAPDRIPLRSQVSSMASGLLTGLPVRHVVRPVGGARRGLSTLLLSVSTLAVIVTFAPLLTLVGVQRLLTPWSGVQWPSRTAILDATSERAHALGTALPLKAILTRTNRAPGETRVQLKFRVLVGERPGELTTALMTPQGQRHDQEVRGEIFERLIDPRPLVESVSQGSPTLTERSRLEYWFETADSRTEAAEIDLVEPPVVTHASLRVTPPAYVAPVSAIPQPNDFVSGLRDLGPGRPDTPAVAPILAGSKVELKFDLNKPIPVPTPSEKDAFAAFAGGLLQGATPPADLTITKEPQSLALSWTARDSIRFGAVLEDEYGIKSPDPAAIALVVVEDRPPTVSIIDPAQDESILATAVIDAVGEARDDVALTSLALEARVLAARADSPGAPPEPRGQPIAVAAWDPAASAGQNRDARAGATLEISTLEVKPGDEVHLSAVAQDSFAFDGQTHAPVISAPRKLRIIGEGQLIEQVLAELGALRAAAIRIDQDEQRLQKDAQSLEQPGGTDRASRLKKEQDLLTERLTPPAALVKRLSDRVDRNALPDRTVRQMLEEARNLLDQASDSSREASRELQDAQGQNPDAPAKAEQSDKARQAQSAVRDAMSRLASVLDQGKDGWATRREIEKLLEDQARISNQTKELARQTSGKRVSDLSPAQKQELERLARAQQELSQRARAATDALQDRASKVRPSDPSQAEAMEKAAEQSSRDQLEGTMQQASKSAGENQTASANEFQQKAEETLKKMMQELDKGQQRRDDSLRRMLADLVQQIEDLMMRQSDSLAMLGDASKVPVDSTVDGVQIRLNQDTIAVAESARKGPPEVAPVADAIDAGASAQASAVKSLRLSPADSPGADRWERSALEHLTEARDLAKKLRDESNKREEDRQREELRKAYDQSLQEQIAIRADSSGFLGKELSRRDRAAVRSLGDKQEALRVKLSELQTKTKELSDEGVFNFSHKRLDTLMTRAARTLRDGVEANSVDADQAASATILRSLVDALSQSKNDDDDFRNSQSNNGGGNQQGGKRPIIPPIAELKLLRALQQDAAGRTRAAADSNVADEVTIGDIGQIQRELARQGQELIKKLSKKEIDVPKTGEPQPGEPKVDGPPGPKEPKEPAQ